MKKILFIIALVGLGFASQAQTTNPFPTTDSLRKFINKWIKNSAVDAFTNLRLNTSLIGMTRFIDSTINASSGVDTFYAVNDTTARLETTDGRILTAIIRGKGGDSSFVYIDYIPQASPPAYSEGRVYYDQSNKALTVFDNISGTSIQLGKELVMDARNNTGSQINDGQVVYVTGAVGQNPTIALAQANSLPTSAVIGIATHNISNNTTGKVTTFGLVNDINTSSFSDGDKLYLSASTPGALTATPPSIPNPIIPVGYCLTSHVTQGKILVSVGEPSTGITQLTGDVTAGPGSGSQAATIANNAVTDGKLRQSVATSVMGRSANSTGNIADIQGAIDGTMLQRIGSTLVFDSLNYTDIKNLPTLDKGVYFSPAEQLNPGFIVFASAIVRPSNSFVNNNPITWEILTHASSHNSSFYDSVWGSTSNQRLLVRYPKVKNVLNTTITPDETFAQHSVFVGPTVGDSTFEANVYRTLNMGLELVGNGTTTWTKQGVWGSNFTISAYTGGQTGIIASPVYAKDPYPLGFAYNGPNGYQVSLTTFGIGGNDVVVNLIDPFGNLVTDPPTSADHLKIFSGGMTTQQVPMGNWATLTNSFMSTFSNFWIFGVFEAWMVAAPVTSTSIQVRWQTDYPSATTYKIYRSSTGINGAFTLIHTGTSGTYVDTGLTPNTLYTYKMVAVVGGVDTPVTTFNANTDF